MNIKTTILSATLVLSSVLLMSPSVDAATICSCTKTKPIKNVKKPCKKLKTVLPPSKAKTRKVRRVLHKNTVSNPVHPTGLQPETTGTVSTDPPILVVPPTPIQPEPKTPLVTPQAVQTPVLPIPAQPETKLGVYGSYNTVTNNVTPEISLSRTLGDKVRVIGYLGIGNTGVKVTPGRSAVVGVSPVEGREAKEAVYENWVSKVTPGKQFVEASHVDRTIVYWQDRNGLLQNSVKDCVLSESELLEKLTWVKNNGGTWYGSRTLLAGQRQYVEETKTEYEKVKVSDAVEAVARVEEVKAQAAIAEKREALAGIVGGVELGYEVVNGVLLTGGGKYAGNELMPTIGISASLQGESGFAEVGVRKSFSNRTDGGTDVRLGGGLKF